MDTSSAIGAASAVLGATFRILEKGYEISAVDDQAKSVLKTVEQVSGQLRDATALRRQKSTLFTKFEKRMIDDNIKFTQEAISLVATLVEPARADLEVSGGSIRFPTRVLFVLRDSPRIQVCLTQLGIASQSLNRDLTLLCGREGRAHTPVPAEVTTVNSAPPPYEEMVFLTEQRQRNTQRKTSALSLSASMGRSAAASTVSFATVEEHTLGVQLVDAVHESVSEREEGAGGVSLSQDHDLAIDLQLAPPAASHGRSSSRSGRQMCGRQRSLRWLEDRT